MKFHMRLAYEGEASKAFAAAKALGRPWGYRVIERAADRLELAKLARAPESPLDLCPRLALERRPGGLQLEGEVELDDKGVTHLTFTALFSAAVFFPVLIQIVGPVIRKQMDGIGLLFTILFMLLTIGVMVSRAYRKRLITSPAYAALRVLGEAIEARARRPRLRVMKAQAARRCAYCHGVFGQAIHWSCARCETCLHADCWDEVGACPTLGCANRAERSA